MYILQCKFIMMIRVYIPPRHLYYLILTMGVRTVLTYGCESVYLNNARLNEQDKTQGKLIKLVLGL